MILFPEGTRSFDGKLGEIKPGISMFISKTNSAIIPTYIFGAHEIWGRGRKWPKLGGKIGCVFGRPILWESFRKLPKKEAQVAVSKKLEESINALQAWYEAGAKGSPP